MRNRFWYVIWKSKQSKNKQTWKFKDWNSLISMNYDLFHKMDSHQPMFANFTGWCEKNRKKSKCETVKPCQALSKSWLFSYCILISWIVIDNYNSEFRIFGQTKFYLRENNFGKWLKINSLRDWQHRFLDSTNSSPCGFDILLESEDLCC